MLLVFGVVGGVGLVVVMIGKVFGVWVIVVVFMLEKCVVVSEYGVDEVINYMDEDLCEWFKVLIGKKGLDVVFDLVGDCYVEFVFCLFGWNGCYFVIGFVGGEIFKLLFNLLLFKGFSFVGVFWGEFVQCELKVNVENMVWFIGWIVEGKVCFFVSECYLLECGFEVLWVLLG